MIILFMKYKKIFYKIKKNKQKKLNNIKKPK